MRFIESLNRNTLFSARLNAEFRKLFENRSTVPDLEVEEPQFIESTDSPLYLYSKSAELGFAGQRAFSRTAGTSQAVMSIGEQTRYLELSTSRFLSQVDGEIERLQLGDLYGVNSNNVLLRTFDLAITSLVGEEKKRDPKTKKSMQGRELFTDTVTGRAIVQDPTLVPERTYSISKVVLDKGEFTTASSRPVVIDNTDFVNDVHNIIRQDNNGYIHSVFRETRHAVNSAAVTFYFELAGLRESNYFSIEVRDPDSLRVKAVQFKSRTHDFENLTFTERRIENRIVLTFPTEEIRGLRVVMTIRNPREVDGRQLVNGFNREGKGLPNIKLLLQRTTGLSEVREDIVGTYFENTFNKASIGISKTTNSGVALGSIFLASPVQEAFVVEDVEGFVEHYLVVDQFRSGGRLVRSVEIPIPGKDVSEYSEILYPKGLTRIGASVRAQFAFAFLPVPGSITFEDQTGDVLSNSLFEYSLNEGATWAPLVSYVSIPDTTVYQRFLVRSSSVNTNLALITSYELASRRGSAYRLSRTEEVFLTPDNRASFRDVGYDNCTVYLKTIVRSLARQQSQINKSVLVCKRQ